MNVEIKGESLKFEIGSIWAVVYDFETLTDGRLAFDLSKTMCLHIAMYGVLLRCNPAMALTMDEFVEELNNIALCKAMTEHLVKRMSVLSQGEAVAQAVEKEGKKEKGEGGKEETPAADNKKKEETTADQSTGTKCTKNVWGVMAWIRRIFSGR